MLVAGKLESKDEIDSGQIYARSFDDLRSPMSSGEVLAEGRLRAYGIILTHLPLIIQRPTCSLPVKACVPEVLYITHSKRTTRIKRFAMSLRFISCRYKYNCVMMVICCVMYVCEVVYGLWGDASGEDGKE